MTGPSSQIAVLLAVKNGAGKLARTLDALNAQTLDRARFEVYVIDDGSTDETAEILARAAAAGRCRVVATNTPSRGLTRSLNQLIAATREPFLARMDCGDTCAPARLAAQLAYLEAHPDVAAVCTSARTFVPPDHFVGPLFEPLFTQLTPSTLRRKNPVFHGSVMMRRAAVAAVGGYDETRRFAQDLDLWLKLLASGREFHWLKAPLYFVEVEAGGISSEHADAQAQLSDEIREQHFGPGRPSSRRMSRRRMLALARLRETALFGRALRLLESVAYEIRCRL